MHLEGTRTCKTYEHAFQFQDILFLWVTRGQHSGQFLGSAEVCASLLSTKRSAIGFFWLVFVFFVVFDVYLYVRGRDWFMWSSSRHFVCFTMVECTRLLFDVFERACILQEPWMLPRACFTWILQNFRTGNLAPEIWQKKIKSEVREKKEGEEKGSTSHPARLVDGLPRAPSQ